MPFPPPKTPPWQAVRPPCPLAGNLGIVGGLFASKSGDFAGARNRQPVFADR